MSLPQICKYCGGRLGEGPGRGRHHKSLMCTRCQRHNGWLPNPQFDEDPGSFAMPFGKYKGKTLREIAAGGNTQYLAWLSQEIKDGAVKRRIVAFLQPRLAVVPVPEPDDDARLEDAEVFWDEAKDGTEPPF